MVADSVHITVYANADEMPPQPDILAAGPEMLQLYPMQGRASGWISLRNTSNSGDILNWTALVDQPWLQLSVTSGSTPGEMQVLVSLTALPEGDYSAWVTLTWGTQEVKVLVKVTVQFNYIYLPLLSK